MGQMSEDLGKYRSTRFAKAPSTFIVGPVHCNKTAMLVQVCFVQDYIVLHYIGFVSICMHVNVIFSCVRVH